MQPTLILDQRQKLIITPDIKQALTILALPALELENYIKEQLEENPVLEVPEDSDSDFANAEGKDDVTPDIKDLFDDSSDLGFGFRDSGNLNENSFEPREIQYSSLHDYLKFQLNITDLSREQRCIGNFIIDSINEEGYLTLDVSEIVSILKMNFEEVNDVLRLIKTFDPPGIGAGDLAECLNLQLDKDDHRYNLFIKILDEYLEDIAANKMKVIAKGLEVSAGEAQELVDVIKKLNPKPGLKFSEEKSVEYITPDVIIERVEHEYIILVNDTVVPRLNISSYYRNLVQGDKAIDEKTKNFIERKLNSALLLIKNIEQRRHTLYKVANAVVEYQRGFLENGLEHLVPLTLKQVADKIGVHESTVSRATKNKFVQTPRGIFPWKFFFSSGVSKVKGEAGAAPGIKKMIQDIINQENPEKPLSDQKLSEILQDKGIDISRRTVTKYREELGIASSGKRKRF